MPSWIKILSTDEIQSMKPVTIKKQNLLILNRDGEYYAVKDCCSHEQAKLSEGDFVDGEIICPKHGARFDPKTGRAKSLPAIKPLETVPVKVENGKIFVEI